MILQTTGGFPVDAFDDELFPLGTWCADGLARPTMTAEDLPSDSDLDVPSESTRLVFALEESLYPALNELHGVDLPTTFWRHTLGVYLRMLVPLLVHRSNLICRARDMRHCSSFTKLDVTSNEVIPDDRPSMLTIVNSHAWNHAVLGELCESLGMTPLRPASPMAIQSTDRSAARKLHPDSRPLRKAAIGALSSACARRTDVLITRSMLPSREEFGLSLRMRTLPFYWDDGFTFTPEVNMDARTRLERQLPSEPSIQSTILKLTTKQLPRVFVEDFAQARTFAQQQLPRRPEVVFTANLHQSSDVFLLWLAESQVSGTKVVIAQHGGVHSLCRNVPGDIQSEREMADRYITWGSPTFASPNTVQGPTLVNVGSPRKKRRFDASETLLIVADSTYRYPSVPRGMNANRFAYAQVLNELIRQLDPDVVSSIIIRPYRGATIWDDPLESLLAADSRVKVDTVFPPIQDLYNSARLVVSTALGTTFFQTLHQNIPTAILLHPEMSPVSDEASAPLLDLKQASILFDDASGLASHLNAVFTNIDEWWENVTTRERIAKFESVLSPSTQSPIDFYASILKNEKRHEVSR